MLDAWAKLIDEEEVTFDSDVADEQAMQKQACDLVTAYLACRSERREAAGRRGCHGSTAGRS